MKNRLKKNSIALIIIALSLSYLGLIFFNSVRIDMRQFEKSCRVLLKKSEMLKSKAKVFNQRSALEALGRNAFNGFYYRFDDHIGEAICKKNPSRTVGSPEVTKILALEFDGNDSVKFLPKKGTAAIKNGVLALIYRKGDYLQTVEDIDLAKDGIGEIELRIRLKRGKRFVLGWTKYSQVDFNYRTEMSVAGVGKILIETIPDGKFHTYTINASNSLKQKLSPDDLIKRLFLFPSGVSQDEVEIDYIRFISKREKYGQNPFGESYEEINCEMRKALYMNTPLCLEYKLSIPKEKCFLKFGMGILEDVPVTYRVKVREKGVESELFSKKVISAHQWNDVRINFSKWSGKDIEVILESESDKGNVAFWSNPVIYTPAKERFNIIIITEDALRADYLSCYGYTRKTTPVKDEWIKNGVLFSHAFAQAAETRPSYACLFTSLYPMAIGTGRYIEMLNDDYLTLAEIMRDQGFITAFFTQNKSTGAAGGMHQGFSYLFDADDRGVGHRANDIYLSKELCELIKSNIDRNFFLVLHLLDPHSPYDPPETFDSWYRQAPSGKALVERSTFFDPSRVVTPTLEGRRLLYGGEVRHNDFYFEDFLKMLKENNLLDNTLLIFSADHGEYLGEHGLWGHGIPGYIQVLHVPLMMVYPNGLPKGVKISQPVQLIDIMPTILDLADIKKDNLLLQGESLLPLIYSQNLDFWNNRLTVSEEELSKDGKEFNASLFYKNWHISLSRILITKELSKAENYFMTKLVRICPNFIGLRLFNYFADKAEIYGINSFFFDLFFKYRAGSFIKKIQKNSQEIYRALTSDTKEKIRYDPEAQEQLRALGYLQ